jgi:hypothetical protein
MGTEAQRHCLGLTARTIEQVLSDVRHQTSSCDLTQGGAASLGGDLMACITGQAIALRLASAA